MEKKTKKKIENKFGTAYYKKKYDSYVCKLNKDESKHLSKFLKENSIGFTEFVRIAIYHLENMQVKKEYNIE